MTNDPSRPRSPPPTRPGMGAETSEGFANETGSTVIGMRVRAVRDLSGMSRHDVARATGLTRREIVAVERGTRPSTHERGAFALAGALGVERDAFASAHDARRAGRNGRLRGNTHRQRDRPRSRSLARALGRPGRPPARAAVRPPGVGASHRPQTHGSGSTDRGPRCAARWTTCSPRARRCRTPDRVKTCGRCSRTSKRRSIDSPAATRSNVTRPATTPSWPRPAARTWLTRARR